MLMNLLITLSLLCEGSNLVPNNNYETDCKSYYINCDKSVENCQLEWNYIYNLQHSPYPRY